MENVLLADLFSIKASWTVVGYLAAIKDLLPVDENVINANRRGICLLVGSSVGYGVVIKHRNVCSIALPQEPDLICQAHQRCGQCRRRPARPHCSVPISFRWETCNLTPVFLATVIISSRASKTPLFSLRRCTANIRSRLAKTSAKAIISSVLQKLPGG